MSRLVLPIIVLLFVTCEPPAKEPTFPSMNWKGATPAEVGIDAKVLRTALDTLLAHCGENQDEQLLIIRDGWAVFTGDSIYKAHNIYSCSKSFTSTALGLMIADGTATLDTRAAEVLPELAAHYPTATLRHFATMTSGYSATGNSRWGEPSADWSWTPYAVDTPLFEPGSRYAYWDEAMMMNGKVLTTLHGGDLKTLLTDRITDPIGLGDWEWWAEDTLANGVPLRNGCTGVRMNADQLARVGHLFLNKGDWDGQQLLPAEWVRAATSVQVPVSTPVADTDRANTKGNGTYGYNWWVNDPTNGAPWSMPDSPPLAYMSGFNHNLCFVIPEWRMVVVRMGEDGNPPEGKWWVWNKFFGILKEGIEPG